MKDCSVVASRPELVEGLAKQSKLRISSCGILLNYSYFQAFLCARWPGNTLIVQTDPLAGYKKLADISLRWDIGIC